MSLGKDLYIAVEYKLVDSDIHYLEHILVGNVVLCQRNFLNMCKPEIQQPFDILNLARTVMVRTMAVVVLCNLVQFLWMMKNMFFFF